MLRSTYSPRIIGNVIGAGLILCDIRGKGLENSIYNPKALKTALIAIAISEELRTIEIREAGEEKSSKKKRSTIE